MLKRFVYFNIKYVNSDANKPCNILPNIYALSDKSLSETILETCIKTEIPPKPSKKAAMQISIIPFSRLVFVRFLNPFVTSKSPFIILSK